MTMMTRRSLQQFCVLTTTVALAATSPLLAQRGGGGNQAASGPGPATVEFVATTADGTVVTDLTAQQVTLRVGNKDRAITSLTRVEFNATATPASALPVPFATNDASAGGRSYLWVIDEESLSPGREVAVREALSAFEKTLSPRDRVALFTIPRGTIALPPTTDREALRAALAKVQGRAKATMTTAERRCHTRDTLTAFASLLGQTAASGVTPVLFFTSGLVGAEASSGVGSSSDCQVQPNDFQRVGPAADIANAQVYVIRPEENRERTALEGLENLVGVTGGQMFHMTGSDALARVAKETSSYYVATFQAEGNERTGQSARLEVKTSRPEVTLRARSTVRIARGSAEAVTSVSLLRTLDVHRGFGLRVVGIPSRNDGDPKNAMKVFALAEAVDPSVKLASAAAALYDPLGKLVSQWTARPEELQRPLIAAAIPAPAGTYRLRFAAVDTNGRAATADYELNATPASAGPAQLGGLMLGAVGEKGFEPILKITDQKEVTVLFELYGRPAGPFGAIVEILPSLTDKPVVSAPPAPSATPVADKFTFSAKLPVADLKPGDYILRAQLAFEGQPTGTLTMTIRKQ
jgi:VWFA-related protein